MHKYGARETAEAVKDQVGALGVVDVFSRRERGGEITQRTQRGLLLFAVNALREKLLLAQRAQSKMHAEERREVCYSLR